MMILEVIAENFPKPMKGTLLQTQEMLWIPSWKNINKTIPNKSVEKQRQKDIPYGSQKKDVLPSK